MSVRYCVYTQYGKFIPNKASPDQNSCLISGLLLYALENIHVRYWS